MHFLQAINSDISVLRVCNKTGGTVKGDIKKYINLCFCFKDFGTLITKYRSRTPQWHPISLHPICLILSFQVPTVCKAVFF